MQRKNRESVWGWVSWNSGSEIDIWVREVYWGTHSDGPLWECGGSGTGEKGSGLRGGPRTQLMHREPRSRHRPLLLSHLEARSPHLYLVIDGSPDMGHSQGRDVILSQAALAEINPWRGKLGGPWATSTPQDGWGSSVLQSGVFFWSNWARIKEQKSKCVLCRCVDIGERMLICGGINPLWAVGDGRQPGSSSRALRREALPGLRAVLARVAGLLVTVGWTGGSHLYLDAESRISDEVYSTSVVPAQVSSQRPLQRFPTFFSASSQQAFLAKPVFKFLWHFFTFLPNSAMWQAITFDTNVKLIVTS